MAAVEMEGAAIAHTCHQFNIPFVVIRSMSDIAGKESPSSFEAYLETAAINSSKLVISMLDALKGKTLN
jgi:adenosylhomocysteine nucleosidase